MIREIWDKILLTVSIPLTAGFVIMAIFGQICVDNLPYLTCEVQ